MSRFYAAISGRSRTGATRLGTERDPCQGHIRGWHVGAEVFCDTDDDVDLIHVYGTRGSAGSGSFHIATLRYNPNGGWFSCEVNPAAERKEGPYATD